jgi:hypothetical protein
MLKRKTDRSVLDKDASPFMKLMARFPTYMLGNTATGDPCSRTCYKSGLEEDPKQQHAPVATKSSISDTISETLGSASTAGNNHEENKVATSRHGSSINKERTQRTKHYRKRSVHRRLNRGVLLAYLCFIPAVASSVSIQGRHCDNDMKQFEPYSNGRCPAGTNFNPDIDCCVGCPVCGPGWKETPKCGVCEPCPRNYYSEDYHNNECQPCPVCQDLNRVELAPCMAALSTECGQCLPGYFVQEGAPHWLACLKCLPGNQEPACVAFLSTSTTVTTKTDPEVEEFTTGTHHAWNTTINTGPVFIVPAESQSSGESPVITETRIVMLLLLLSTDIIR